MLTTTDNSARPVDSLGTLEIWPASAGRLAIAFGTGVAEKVRCRIEYSFRVFCAVYGYRVVDDSTHDSDVRICYAGASLSSRDLIQPGCYETREPSEAAPVPTPVQVGEFVLPCFHLKDADEPDWLAEVFEWISAADEQAITERDSVGRVPYERTLHGRFAIDPTIPYAAVAMRGLNNALRELMGERWLATPTKPWAGRVDCVVAATHDVDFLPLDTATTLWRLFKNLAISAVSRDWPRAWALTSSSAIGALRGSLPLNAIRTVRVMEQKTGVGSTYNIIGRQEHRRDANYSIADQRTQAELRWLEGDGFELGLHGSYTSLESPGKLAEEYEMLRQIGHRVVGGRQHWLRYHDNQLFDELSTAGACYDCTVGYSARIGFRTGACFPYPPYDFENERPYPFLELPMPIMDSALYDYSQRNSRRAEELIYNLLQTVRDFGWGGVSILWHDTVFDGGQYPKWLGDLYWKWKAENDSALSCIDLVKVVWPRYEAAGLLPPLDELLA